MLSAAMCPVVADCDSHMSPSVLSTLVQLCRPTFMHKCASPDCQLSGYPGSSSDTSIVMSMQGLPLSLSGVRKIMNMMDWGDIGDFVSFGEVGRDQIDDASYYILIAPQNVVGSTILTNLGDMV